MTASGPTLHLRGGGLFCDPRKELSYVEEKVGSQNPRDGLSDAQPGSMPYRTKGDTPPAALIPEVGPVSAPDAVTAPSSLSRPSETLSRHHSPLLAPADVVG